MGSVSRKKILMLLNAPFPDDIRVSKEANALIKAGYEVHLLCRRRKQEKPGEIVGGIKVQRIDAGISNPQLALRDIRIALSGSHPEFLKAAAEIIRNEQIDFIHVHDLPLTGTALRLRQSYPDIKVIADLHENYPEGLKVWHKWKKNPVVRLKNQLFMGYRRWHQLEKEFTSGADHIIAVVEEMKSRMINDHGIADSKISVVTNTEERSFLDQTDDPAIYSAFGKFIISYTGGIGPHRGVDTLIKAMSHLKDIEECHLVISGFGSPQVMKFLEKLIKELNLDGKVTMRGKVPFGEFYSLMKYAGVNVIPHNKNGHTDHTVPHKLFQTMMANGTLVVSDVAPLKRIVEECQCGLVFEAGNDLDLADKIRVLMDDENLRNELGRNGSKGASSKYNWESTSQVLVQTYNDF